MSYKLVNGNCISYLKTYDGEKFDMIFADPPYRLSNDGITCQNGKMTSVNKGDWDKTLGYVENYQFDKEWISLCLENLKKDGTMWVSGTYHNIHTIGSILQELGACIINEVTWFKPNAAPNISCRAFTASHETLLWVKKSKKSKHTFNYEVMKKMNCGKQMRAMWEIPTTPKKEKIFSTHPTQKPQEVLKRCILASTKEGDLIFDPFSGSGTTGVVAIKYNRNYIGVELDEKFISESEKRLKYEDTSAKPFVKWAGGKTQLLPVIQENLPTFDKTDTYIEPFVGAGAVFLKLMQSYEFENVVINDMNNALINTYKVIRDNAEELMKILDRLEEEYNLLDDEEQTNYYLSIRKRYNSENRITIDGAANFIFLNKTCFNGLYRENSKGEFNVPSGKKKKVNLYDKFNILKISSILKEKNSKGKRKVKIMSGDYKKIEKLVNENTFVYFDPPYRPITKSGFNQYHKSGFSDESQVELAKFYSKLSNKGAKLMLSNSDPKNLEEAEQPDFFDNLYKEFVIKRVSARRNINSNSKGRGAITEILVINSSPSINVNNIVEEKLIKDK